MKKVAVAAFLGTTVIVGGCANENPETSESEPTSSSTSPQESDPQSETGASPATGTNSDDSRVELRAAAQAYSDAFLEARPQESYELLSARCQDRQSPSEWRSILMAVEEEYGTALPMRTFEAEISGDLARVTYTYDIAQINQTDEPWVREEGEWKQDDC